MNSTITINHDKLRTALAAVAPVIERAHNLPVLQCALLEADGERLRITGSRLEQYIEFAADAQVSHPARVCLEFRRLQQIAGVAEGDVRFDISAQAAIVRYDRSRHKLPILNFSEFPLPPWSGAGDDYAELDGAAVWPLIENVAFTAAQSDIRYYLLGVNLCRDDQGLHAAATDGYRLSAYTQPEQKGQAIDIIIPRTIIPTLLKLRPPQVRIYRNRIEAIAERVRIGSGLIEGRFPDWRRVSSAAGDHRIEVDRAALARGLDRATTCAAEKMKGIKLVSADAVLNLRAEDSGASADIEIAADITGDMMDWGVNGTYLADAVRAFGELTGNTDRIALLHTGSAQSALQIRHHDAQHRDWVHVIMGMRT